MKTERVTCDGCGADLKHPRWYWLSLHPEGIRGHGAITRDHHFCDLSCIDQWRGREQMIALSWHKWMENGGAEPGIVGGFVEAPPEEHQRLRAEFEAAALAAFPMRRQG
jgi:hypothetical protein